MHLCLYHIDQPRCLLQIVTYQLWRTPPPVNHTHSHNNCHFQGFSKNTAKESAESDSTLQEKRQRKGSGKDQARKKEGEEEKETQWTT